MRNRILAWLATAAMIVGSIMPAGSITAQAKNTTASGTPVTVTAAVIQGSNVVVTATGNATTDDGVYYLYAQDTYMSGTQGTMVAQAAAGSQAVFSFPLNKNTASSNLYKKFTVVGVKNGAPSDLSNDMYITNPEATASHTQARHDAGKKGLLPDAAQIQNTGTLKSLGVNQITYNLEVGRLLNGGGINYTYNGKTYTFNKNVIGEYDLIVPKMNNAGIQVNLILLCDQAAGNLIHPLSLYAGKNYYMFNTTDTTALEKLEAVASFLGERYSGTGHGTVDNWIIGNEVNARDPWNYMDAGVGLNGFAKAYADEFRIFYNALKAQNANCRVYAAVDQEWKADSALHYGAKEMLTALNSIVKAEGNIDWSLASHPYNYPLYGASVLTSSAKVTHTQNTSYITMANIDVLTDFMCQTDFLNPAGQVRSIALTEVGYTSSAAMVSNEALQAANIVFAINQANANQHIDGIIINRQRSDMSEIAQGLDFGLTNADFSAKTAYSWYASATSPDIIAAAGAVLGADIASSITVR